MPPTEELRWFNDVVMPCEPALRAYLHKRFPLLGDHDDLLQEAYSRLLRAKREGRLTCPKAFLFTITRNLAIDTFRRRQRTANHEPLSEVVEVPALESVADNVASLEHQRRLEVLIDAVASLPDRCREVMMLRHIDGLAYKEIAEQLGISPNTVKVHLVKGVRDCTAFFSRHGLLETGGEAAPAEPLKEATR